jgi:plastocyanin
MMKLSPLFAPAIDRARFREKPLLRSCPDVRPKRISLGLIALCSFALGAFELGAHGTATAQNATLPPKNAATVRISNALPLPRIVYIALGNEVNWINADDRPHLVKAANDRFPQFSLIAKGQHSVLFSKPGSYPYKVDAEGDGIVVVSGGGSGAGGGGGSLNREPDTGGPFTYYEWEGTIKKQWSNNFNVRPNKIDSKWTGEFRVRFAQIPGTSNGSYIHEDGTSSQIYNEEGFPLDLDYSITGDAVHSTEGRPGPDVTVHGRAEGRLRDATLIKLNPGRENDVPQTDFNDDPRNSWHRMALLPDLKGMFQTFGPRLDANILRISTAHPASPAEGSGKPSRADVECGYLGDLPGNYRITIDLLRASSFPRAENVSLFQGIQVIRRLGGDRDNLVSTYVDLSGADVCGRIFSADQAEVTGSRSYGIQETGHIVSGTDTWHFRRTPKQITYKKSGTWDQKPPTR